jgi:hypothetical protein
MWKVNINVCYRICSVCVKCIFCWRKPPSAADVLCGKYCGYNIFWVWLESPIRWYILSSFLLMASTQPCILRALSIFKWGLFVLCHVINIIYLSILWCGWNVLNDLQQKMKYQVTLCDAVFTFQVLVRQGRLQHDITVHEPFEGCSAKCGAGLDRWDTDSSRDTTSSRYTYGPCGSFWSLVCLKKFIKICI